MFASCGTSPIARCWASIPPLADGASDLPALPERVAQFEAHAIRDALASAGGDIATTLALLRIPRKTLYDKIARHGIDPKTYRS